MGKRFSSDLKEIWKEMSKKTNSVFKGIGFSDLQKNPVLIDGSKWENLPFVEKKALHYDPPVRIAESAGS